MRKSRDTDDDLIWDPDAYDSWYDTDIGKTIDLIETECILSLLIPIKGKKVLDVGCGTGNFVRKLDALGYDVIGIEPDRAMRAKAIEKGLRCIEGRAEDIPFPDGSFDAVLSVTSLEFFEDKEKAVLEMIRVLKPGGKLVIGTIIGSWREYYESQGKRRASVFSKASFPNLDSLISLPGFASLKTCLFTGPNEKPSFEKERFGGIPGFACLLFKKPGEKGLR